MAWTPESRKAAGERLKAARLKKHIVEQQVAVMEKPVKDEGYDLMLGFKIIRNGNFHGLWEMYKMTPNGPVQIGTATSKLLIINMARTQIGSTGI